VVLAGSAAGCGRDEFEDRTARVSVDGRTTTYEVVSCGLDDTTLFVVGESKEGSVLQAVVGLEDDGSTGVPDATGVSVSADAVDLSAFGPASWARREGVGDPPGEIASAQLKGSRIQVGGRLVPLDPDGAVAVTGSELAFSLDARCDERDD
jgi:hypothetical protein